MMRLWSLASLAIVCAGCRVAVPQPPGLHLELKAAVHVDVRVPPPPPPPAVPLQGAPVVEFFGIPLDGAQDVVFVLDRSGSMNGPAQGRLAQLDQPEAANAPAGPSRKIDVAHSELIDALKRLPAGTRLNIVFFNSGLEAFAQGLVPLEESDRDGLIGFVQSMLPSGRTALAPAMRTAFLMNPKRVVLLSDGLGNVGGGVRAVLRDAREAMRGGVRIDTVGLGGDQNAGLLATLARESGGLYQAL